MLSLVLPAKHSFVASYLLYDFFGIAFFLTIFYRYLRSWFSREQALIGILITAVGIPVALRDHFYQPWSILEAGLFTAALLTIYHQKYVATGLIVLLAGLNRETGIFIPLIFVCVHWESIFTKKLFDRRIVLWACVFFFIWLTTFLGLRLLLGFTPHVLSLTDLLTLNMQKTNLLKAMIHLGLFLGVLWVGVLGGYGRLPPFPKKAVRIIPFYLVVFLVWGVWYETRLLLPLYPVLLPPVLSFFFRPQENL